MRGNKKKLLLAVGLLVGMVLINLDLFHFQYESPFQRTFTPDTETKNDYILTESVVLKPGTYQLSFLGSVEGHGSGWFFLNAQGEVLHAADFPMGSISEPISVAILQSAQQVRVGVRYDPESGPLTIQRIRITGDHVLYKESLTRHLILSLVWVGICVYLYLRVWKPSVFKKCFGISVKGLASAEKILLFCLVMALIASIPCLLPQKYVVGDDLYFHLYRIEGIASGLKAGYFPSRIYLNWMENYGVGSGLYYPDLFLYIPALLYLCGFQLLHTYHFFVVLCAFFTCLTIYLAVRRVSGGSKRAAVVASLLYTLAAYRLISIYYRSALGEVQAFVFYPLIIWGLYELFHDHSERWPIFAIGFGGMLSTHLISLALAGIFTLVVLLISLPKWLNDKKIWRALFFSFISVMIICAAFWVPMLEQCQNNDLFFQEFMTSTDTQIGPANWMPGKALFAFFDPWHFVEGSYQPYPGWSLLAVILLFGFLCLKHEKTEPWLRMAFFLGCVLLWMSTDWFPWQIFVWLLKRIQVSWRLLAPASCLLSLCGGIFSDRLFKRMPSWGLYSGSLALALLCAVPIFVQGIEYRYAVPKAQILLDQEVNAGEYMPTNLSREFIEANGDTVLTAFDQEGALISDDSVKISGSRRTGLRFRFDFADASENMRFSLPLIFHYGYQGEIIPQDGGETRELDISKDDLGLISVSNGADSSGTIHVHYEKTPLTKISEYISLIGIFCAVVLEFRRRKACGKDAYDELVRE